MSQQPDHNNNLMVAVVLSLAVMFAWQYFVVSPKMKQEQERIEREKQEQGIRPPTPATATPPVPGAAAPGSAAPPVAKDVTAVRAPIDRATALKSSPRLAVETPSLKGSIALKGGHIDDLELAKYHETVDPRSHRVVLFSPLESPEPYFAEYGWLPGAAGQPVPGAETVWTPVEDGAPLTPSHPVTLTWNNGQGLVFRRTISVDANYMFKITDEVENKGAAEVSLAPYGRIYRIGKPKVQGFYILHEGLIGMAGEDGLQEFTYADALKTSLSKTFDKVKGGWLGVTDKYWAAALIPSQADTFKATFAARKAPAGSEADVYYTDYVLPTLAVPAGASKAVSSNLYAGAKQVALIDGYEKQLGIKRFDRMIDWGWFYFITKPLFYLMELINNVVHNFGVTILVLTLIVKGLFFPLANKSYESMAKMKKLQPQMEAIRERFKEDKARQQQEMMALYGKEKINPAAGCLPVLVQIPVFFALYKVLFVTIDMRHAPFFGWIKDLSAPDPTSIFNLFGLLPFAVPEHLGPIPLQIGAWAILMGITMWLQMQLNPPQPDPVQQQVFQWMPLLFTFMLASFPVGLVIYWAWNNMLSIAQQAYIMKKQGTEIPLKDNLKRIFGPLGKYLDRKS